METINIVAENQQCIDWYIQNEIGNGFRGSEITVGINKNIQTGEIKKYLLCKVYVEG